MAPVLAALTVACLILGAAADNQEASPFAGEKTYGTPTDPSMGPASGVSPVVSGPIASPYTPSTPAPASTPGTCSFWSSHTSSFPDFLSILTTLLDLFGSGTSGGSGGLSGITSIFGGQMTLYQGLTNNRPDAYGALLRQGTAAILNSYTNRNYPYTPFQVKAAFHGALASQQSAAVMATNFENANNGYGRRN